MAVPINIGVLPRRFSVAAGILPAVEPGRPARRRKRSHTPTVLENFRTVLIFHRSFRAAGRQPSTADETSAATTPSPFFPESRQTAPMLIGTAIHYSKRAKTQLEKFNNPIQHILKIQAQLCSLRPSSGGIGGGVFRWVNQRLRDGLESAEFLDAVYQKRCSQKNQSGKPPDGGFPRTISCILSLKESLLQDVKLLDVAGIDNIRGQVKVATPVKYIR